MTKGAAFTGGLHHIASLAAVFWGKKISIVNDSYFYLCKSRPNPARPPQTSKRKKKTPPIPTLPNKISKGKKKKKTIKSPPLLSKNLIVVLLRFIPVVVSPDRQVPAVTGVLLDVVTLLIPGRVDWRRDAPVGCWRGVAPHGHGSRRLPDAVAVLVGVGSDVWVL